MLPELRVLHIERRPRRKRLAVYLSDGETLFLTADVAAGMRLAAGATITEERREEIKRVQAGEDAMTSALRLIAFRPRSEKELRMALARRSISPVFRDETITRLRELGLLDDAAFAASFVETRDRSSPRSRRLLAQELRQKGLAHNVAAGAAEAVDDADAAYRAAGRRARSLSALPYLEFERRLGTFLLRRGFNYATTRATVKKLWAEQSVEAGADSRHPNPS